MNEQGGLSVRVFGKKISVATMKLFMLKELEITTDRAHVFCHDWFNFYYFTKIEK